MNATKQTETQISANWKAPFFTMWAGQAFSMFGSMIVQFALVWWLTQETNSATILTTAALLAYLPGIFLSPFAGALVDRWNRRVVMMVSDTLVAISTVVIVLLFWSGAIQAWHIYVVLFLRGLGGAIQFPAMQASTSLMVPEQHLGRVAGLNQSLNGALSIVAPPAGAFLMGLLPIYSVLSIDIITAAMAILPLFFIRIPQPPHSAAAPASVNPLATLYADVRSGFRYILSWPAMVAVIALAVVLNFLINPISALMPLLVTRHFNGGVIELGWTDSIFGLGMVAGGILLSVWGGFKRQIKTTLLGVIGLGVGILMVGLAPANMFWLGLLGLGIAGMMNPLTNGPVFAIIQSRVAPEMQGRIISVLISLCSAMAPIGLLLSGPVSDRFGIQTWFIVSGIICSLMGIGACFIPILRTLEDRKMVPLQAETE